VEREPSEREELINKDRASWVMRATKLHEAGLAAVQAVDAKDPQKVFEVGEQIEQACENCHRQYWYPNEQIPPVPASTQ
jgi:cytochrome c556